MISSLFSLLPLCVSCPPLLIIKQHHFLALAEKVAQLLALAAPLFGFSRKSGITFGFSGATFWLQEKSGTTFGLSSATFWLQQKKWHNFWLQQHHFLALAEKVASLLALAVQVAQLLALAAPFFGFSRKSDITFGFSGATLWLQQKKWHHFWLWQHHFLPLAEKVASLLALAAPLLSFSRKSGTTFGFSGATFWLQDKSGTTFCSSSTTFCLQQKVAPLLG